MANLPVLKALMTSRHPPTIQDASGDLFRLSGGDLFALVDDTNHIVGFHTRAPGLTPEQAQVLRQENTGTESRQWWFAAGHLYEVFLTPIYFGPAANQSQLGTLAVGYEINEKVAHELARAASGEVAVICAGQEVVSTIAPGNIPTLEQALAEHGMSEEPLDVKLEHESFVMTSLKLNQGSPPVTILVMKSYDQAAEFLSRLRQLLLGVGLGAVVIGSLLVYLIASTFTRPLEALVHGVRALGKGDYSFPLDAKSNGEIGELTTAFTGCGEAYTTPSSECSIPNAWRPLASWRVPYRMTCGIRLRPCWPTRSFSPNPT